MRIFVALSIILLLGACAGNPVKQVRYDPPASIPIGVNALLNLPPNEPRNSPKVVRTTEPRGESQPP